LVSGDTLGKGVYGNGDFPLNENQGGAGKEGKKGEEIGNMQSGGGKVVTRRGGVFTSIPLTNGGGGVKKVGSGWGKKGGSMRTVWKGEQGKSVI